MNIFVLCDIVTFQKRGEVIDAPNTIKKIVSKYGVVVETVTECDLTLVASFDGQKHWANNPDIVSARRQGKNVVFANLGVYPSIDGNTFDKVITDTLEHHLRRMMTAEQAFRLGTLVAERVVDENHPEVKVARTTFRQKFDSGKSSYRGKGDAMTRCVPGCFEHGKRR